VKFRQKVISILIGACALVVALLVAMPDLGLLNSSFTISGSTLRKDGEVIAPLPGLKIELFAFDDPTQTTESSPATLILETTTDADGNFSFESIPTGATYKLVAKNELLPLTPSSFVVDANAEIAPPNLSGSYVFEGSSNQKYQYTIKLDKKSLSEYYLDLVKQSGTAVETSSTSSVTTSEGDPIQEHKEELKTYYQELVQDKDELSQNIQNVINPTSVQRSLITSFPIVNRQPQYCSIVTNSLTFELTPTQAEIVSKISGVQSVSLETENLSTQADEDNNDPPFSMNEIYEAIKLSRVRDLKDKNGKELNGAGVNLAIIDHGIDYSWSEFGACTKAQVISNTCPKVRDALDLSLTMDLNNDGDLNDCFNPKTFATGRFCELTLSEEFKRNVDLNENGNFNDCFQTTTASDPEVTFCEATLKVYDNLNLEWINQYDLNNDRDSNDCYKLENSAQTDATCEVNYFKDRNRDGDNDDCFVASASGKVCEIERETKAFHGEMHGSQVGFLASGLSGPDTSVT
jgi:hypothetical protein